MKELIGSKIDRVIVENSMNYYIVFISGDKEYIYAAQGECCSESWFYHILGIDCLIGHTVQKVDEIDMGEIDDGLTRQGYDKLYKITLTTESGYCDIEFRNSSNGYYGGWCSYTESAEEGKTHLQMNPKHFSWQGNPGDFVWKEVTEDWTA